MIPVPVKAYSYIRFSTLEQAKGDSLRRQIEKSIAYAKKHDLILDESLNLQDLGLSAFSGTHRTKGALGEFLELIDKGQIAKGSVLIVENLDRLSREKVLDALNQFTSIIKAGISIVTLQDGIKYTNESINQNWAQLIISITYMARAHDESKTKSIRLKAAWDEKRRKVYSFDKKLTSQVPAWIKATKVKEKIELTLIADRRRAIELIFRKKLEGKGGERIAKELNLEKNCWKPLKSKRNKTGGWRASYIKKILRNRSVIGEFQLYKISNQKREPINEPIKDYYPRAIPDELFYQVQSQIKLNSEMGSKKGFGGGKTGKGYNLFTHIIKCGLCGSPVHYIDKGNSSKGGKYLHCDSSRRKTDLGKRCIAKPIRYNEFKNAFFREIDEVNIDKILPQESKTQIKINDRRQQLDIVEYKKEEIKSSLRRFEIAIQFATNVNEIKELVKKRESLRTEDEYLLDNRRKLIEEVKNLESQRRSFIENMSTTKELFSLLNSVDEEKAIQIRFQLRKEIRRVIDWINIFPYRTKEEEYTILQEQYVKLKKKAEKIQKRNSFSGRIVLNDVVNQIKELEEDIDNTSIYGGYARVKFNPQEDFNSATILLDKSRRQAFERS